MKAVLLKLAWQSILNRKQTAFLTLLSIALSVALILTVQKTKRLVQEGFTQSISQVDLLVGARTGELNLLLYTLFNMGSATQNISYETYSTIKNHPDIEWTIPISLGDGHKGYRVIATDENFFEHYRYRKEKKIESETSGLEFKTLFSVVIGSEVAQALRYTLGDKIIVSHGSTHEETFLQHSEWPFTIKAILKPTGTFIDKSVFVRIEAMEIIHMDWQSGAYKPVDLESTKTEAELIKQMGSIKQLTSFFVRSKSRIKTLLLQREINDFKDEPLLAVIPAVGLSKLWNGLSSIDQVLTFISWLVYFVGLLSLVSLLLSTANERRREMAILRSIGAMPYEIGLLLSLESFMLTLWGIFLGLILSNLGFIVLQKWFSLKVGFYYDTHLFDLNDGLLLIIMLLLGLFSGLLPALKIKNQSLKDGLSVKT